jgi:hypothetical protein
MIKLYTTRMRNMNVGKPRNKKRHNHNSPGIGPGDIPVWLAIFLTVCIHKESQTSEQLGQDDDQSPHLLKLFPGPQITIQLLAHFHKPTQQSKSHSTDSFESLF